MEGYSGAILALVESSFEILLQTLFSLFKQLSTVKMLVDSGGRVQNSDHRMKAKIQTCKPFLHTPPYKVSEYSLIRACPEFSKNCSCDQRRKFVRFVHHKMGFFSLNIKRVYDVCTSFQVLYLSVQKLISYRYLHCS